ncbi:MAG: hypothetical protein ACRC3H_07255 [Lachnospiraceae bacterium]
MKFVDLIKCITAGENIIVYHRKEFKQAFIQGEPGIYQGNVSGCYEDLKNYYDRCVSIQTLKDVFVLFWKSNKLIISI